MPTITRLESQAIWDRLCEEVLCAPADSSIKLAFEHNGGTIRDLREFETATPRVIDQLQYEDNGVIRQLNPGMKNTIVYFQQFIESLRVNNNDIPLDCCLGSR